MQDVNRLDVSIVEFSGMPPMPFHGAVITIGNFDGLHLGHQAVITQMVQKAKERNRPVVVVTFFPNPSRFFKKTPSAEGSDAYYLLTPGEKEDQLKALGVEQVITFRFDQMFASLSAEDFLAGLKDTLDFGVLVVGEDFALGKNRQGTIPVIKAIGQHYSFQVETIPQVKLSHGEISSTMIRRLLDDGAVAKATNLLGRPYMITGVVSHGADRGGKIGLPTANMSYWEQKKRPGVGVYATLVDINGRVFQGITNIGYRPTFENDVQANIETHILDFNQNIYGEKISLAFIQKLRDEQKFSDVDALLAQIERDKAKARRILSHVET